MSSYQEINRYLDTLSTIWFIKH